MGRKEGGGAERGDHGGQRYPHPGANPDDSGLRFWSIKSWFSGKRDFNHVLTFLSALSRCGHVRGALTTENKD